MSGLETAFSNISSPHHFSGFPILIYFQHGTAVKGVCSYVFLFLDINWLRISFLVPPSAAKPAPNRRI